MPIVYEAMSLEDWCEIFTNKTSDVWDSIDSANAWLRFVETANTRIAELVRLGSHSELVEALGDAFGWLCCFSGRYGEGIPGESFRFIRTLPRMIWNKYPGVCYRCTHKFSEEEINGIDYIACVCLSTPVISLPQKKIAKENKLIAKEKKTSPTTLDEWTKMTKDIYGPNHSQLSLPSICLHFLEEVGEVAEGLRELRDLDQLASAEEKKIFIYNLQDEIADVFSWIMGLLNKIDQIFEMGRDYYKIHGIADPPPITASSVAARALENWNGDKVP